MAHALKFFFAPNSRAMSILWLLEELGVPYDTEIVDINGEGGAPERYRAIQPHKKVPAPRGTRCRSARGRRPPG